MLPNTARLLNTAMPARLSEVVRLVGTSRRRGILVATKRQANGAMGMLRNSDVPVVLLKDYGCMPVEQ